MVYLLYKGLCVNLSPACVVAISSTLHPKFPSKRT